MKPIIYVDYKPPIKPHAIVDGRLVPLDKALDALAANAMVLARGIVK